LALGGSAELTYLSSLDESLSWKKPEEVLDGYDGVIFGGSRDYDFDGGRKIDDPFRILAMLIFSRTRNLIRLALAKDMPGMGICFGHQVTANMFGGKVENDVEQSKRGTFRVTLTDEGRKDIVFKSLPESFDAQYAHKDSVTKMPGGATLLARGDHCCFSALRYGNSMYTVQFHPEMTAERLSLTINSNKGSLPLGIKTVEEIVRPTPDALQILPLWLHRVVRRAT
jgi:GMP synthase (glutamine-hydrolysing)